MSAGLVVLIVIVAVVVMIAAVAIATISRRRRLQSRFGPEYDRVVDAADSRRAAHRDLGERMRRHDELDIRPLTSAAASRYNEQWLTIQQQFVDDPETAVMLGHRLLCRVMAEVGYPTDEDVRTDLLSVEHAEVIDGYRNAAAVEAQCRQGEVSTEDLRQALQNYRSLFERLLGDSVPVDNSQAATYPRSVDLTRTEVRNPSAT